MARKKTATKKPARRRSGVSKRRAASGEDAGRIRQPEVTETDLLAAVAHELRSPLAVMRSIAEALRVPKLSPATLSRALDLLDRQTQSMARMIDDLLDAARQARGETPQQPPRRGKRPPAP